jgi:non-canonical purine NTP pyrophosphatase (RdgB/HAM1 family)
MRCALHSRGVRVTPGVRSARERCSRSLRVHCSSTWRQGEHTSAHVLMFVTGNQGKVDRLRLALSLQASNPGVEVDGIDLALPEIQADTVLEVALAKAKSAHERLQRPLLIHDCGLCCAALKDAPGPYTKYFNFSVGTEGLLALMRDQEDRRAGWDDAIVYIDENGHAHSFSSLDRYGYTGEISATGPTKYLRFEGPERAIGRCFVPTSFGLTECLADVSEEDYQRYRREAPSVWNDFAAWYAARETETK